MTALADTPVSPKAENTEGSRETEIIRGALAGRMPGAIRQLFRDVKTVLTVRGEPAPTPAMKRKRREETGRAFRMTAKKLVRRAVRFPAEAYARATAYLADTLDWLNLWHHNDEEFIQDVQPDASEHLYPHL